MKIQVPNNKVLEVVKRIFWVAYQSSHVLGMGKFQARSDATEDEVWENILNNGDYPYNPRITSLEKGIHADYVFGRMMKLSIRIVKENGNTFVDVPDMKPQPDYQSWAGRFGSCEDLALEAMKQILEDTTVNDFERHDSRI